MSKRSDTTTLGVYVRDIEFCVTIHTWPASKGARDSFNGRAGAGLALEPDDPGGFEIEHVSIPRQEAFDYDDICSITNEDIEQAVERELEAMADEQDY